MRPKWGWAVRVCRAACPAKSGHGKPDARLPFQGALLRLSRDPRRAGGGARRPSDDGTAGSFPRRARRGSAPAHLPLRQPGRPAERSQRAVLLAGAVASVLPGVPAGRSAPALGPCRKRRSDPLAGSAVLHLSAPGRVLLLRRHVGGGGPGDRHVPRHEGGQHGGHGQRPAAVELAQGGRWAGDSFAAQGRRCAVSGVRSVHLAARRLVLRALCWAGTGGPRRHPVGGGFPVPLAGLGTVGVSAPVHRGGPLHAARRRRRLPLLLAHRRQAHAAVLQPHERRPVSARRLRHRAPEARGHRRWQVQYGAGGARRRPRALGDAGRRGDRRHLQHEPRQAHRGLGSDHEPAAAAPS